MEACAENAGKIYFRSQIKLPARDPDSPATGKVILAYNTKYICIYIYQVWKWVEIGALSGAMFKKHKEYIVKEIYEPNDTRTIRDYPIKISANVEALQNSAQAILGTFYPATEFCKEGEFQVYCKPRISNESDASRWLYVVQEKPNSYAWWLGNSDNMLRRRAHGWWHSVRTNTNNRNDVEKSLLLDFSKSKFWDGKPHGTDIGAWQDVPRFTDKAFTISLVKENDCRQRINELKNEYNELSSSNARMLGIIKELYNKFSVGEKQNLCGSILKGLLKDANLCSICFAVKPLVKCIHFDCIGACAECRKHHADGGGGDGTCCACRQEQKAECPICFDVHTKQYLKILPCKHVVCWKCFCNSYECNRPIKKCPKCRVDIDP